MVVFDGSPDLRCTSCAPGRSAPFLRRTLPGRPKSRPPSYTGRGSNGPPPSDLVCGWHLATWTDIPTRIGYTQPRVNPALANKKKPPVHDTSTPTHTTKENSRHLKTTTKLHVLHVALTSYLFSLRCLVSAAAASSDALRSLQSTQFRPLSDAMWIRRALSWS